MSIETQESYNSSDSEIEELEAHGEISPHETSDIFGNLIIYRLIFNLT